MNTVSTWFIPILLTSIFTFAPEAIFSQNGAVSWCTFSSGFGIPASPAMAVMSCVGQTFIGSSQAAGTLIESGFLASPLLRGSSVGIDDPAGRLQGMSLSQNYPNPFNATTAIRYMTAERVTVTLDVSDLLGRRVAFVLDNERVEAGEHIVPFHSAQLTPGIYSYRLRVGGEVLSRLMTVVR